MAKLLQGVYLAPNDYKVFGVHHEPENLSEEYLDRGILIDIAEIVEPNIITGKMPELHFNPATNAFWYQYIDIPMTQEDRLTQLEQLVADLASLQLGVQSMDERVLRLYRFLLKMGRITIEQVPYPYKTELSV